MLDRYGAVRYLRNLVYRNFRRSIKFSISGWVGFGFVELFTFLLFHVLKLGNLIAVSSAFFIGVAAEYLINEFWTTREAGIHTGRTLGLLRRLFKFEIINLAGTALAVGIQYVLFLYLNLDPLIGNLIGSGLTLPVNYYLQMKGTWGIRIT